MVAPTVDRLDTLLAAVPDDKLDDLLATLPPEQAQVILNARARQEQRADEDDWATWLPWLFPSYFSVAFAPHHAEFWTWVWSIELGIKPDKAFIGVWARGGAKSTSAEAAVVSLGARKKRTYVVYVCHAKGTMICAEHGWQPVEEHPTALPRLQDRTLRVKLAGVPFDEVVSPEHRYWARRIARRDHGHDRPVEIRRTRPNWCEADDLDWNTWLGLPIDQTVEDVAPTFQTWRGQRAGYVDEPCPWADTAAFWWTVGLWWGDGTLGGGRGQQISWATADAHPEIRARLIDALTSFGLRPKVYRRNDDAVADVTVCHAGFSRWLRTWKADGNSRKAPPAFVERLPLEKQAPLMRGYLDADGYVDHRAASIVSVHLDGLLTGRRILARLGIPSGISRYRPAGTSEFRGRSYVTQAQYRLRFVEGVEALGISPLPRTNDVRDLWIGDGCLWSRVRSVEENGPEIIVPIQTATHDYVTAFARSHNCMTQPQADDHVSNIAAMLESEQIGKAYPELGERALGKFGNSKGWRRNRLQTSSGFTVDALGLDTAARGLKMEEARPDLIVFDDLDDTRDGPGIVNKKIEAITQKLLPAGSSDVAVLGIQNLVHRDGVFGHLVGVAETENDDFLTDRIVSGPIPALENATFDLTVDPETGKSRWTIMAGEPTWEGQTRDICQGQVSEWGITSFRAEAQHDTDAKGGGMFDHIIFSHCLRADCPPFLMTVVWVDPAVTNTDKSDSMAIQCDGIADGVIYRLRSWEKRDTPVNALKLAIAWGMLEGAKHVGVETDQGGDTWSSVYKEAAKAVRDDLIAVRRGTSTGIDGVPEYVAAIAELSGWERIPPTPHFAEDKAGSTQQPKEHRIQQMLAQGYETGPGIIHVLDGTNQHLTLERALFRFPARKPYDLCLAPGTLIETPTGRTPIECLHPGDQVVTRDGPRTVLAAGLSDPRAERLLLQVEGGRTLVGTANHPVWSVTDGAWKDLGDLRYGDMVLVCTNDSAPTSSASTESSTVASTSEGRSRTSRSSEVSYTSSTRDGTTTARSAAAQLAEVPSTAKSGPPPTAPSPTDTTSTTSTGTLGTTTSTTSSASPEPSTERSTARRWSRSDSGRTWRRSAVRRRSGTAARRVARGIALTALGLGRAGRTGRSSALSAAEPSQPATPGRPNSARPPAGTPSPPGTPTTTSTGPAPAGPCSGPGSGTGKHTAAVRVLAEPTALSVGTVYNLKVEGTPEFFANGILVHNCDAAYWSWRDLAQYGRKTTSNAPKRKVKRLPPVPIEKPGALRGAGVMRPGFGGSRGRVR